MLSDFAKKNIADKAKRDFDDNVSMAGSVYKFADEHFGWEVAEAAQAFYVEEQQRLIAELDRQADEADYQRGVEM